jgi:predicted lactoylglutathione lyase
MNWLAHLSLSEPNLEWPIHLAFKAPTKKAVEDFYRIGLEFGGRDNGAPADRRNGAYGAYLLDPDGNYIEAIYRQ